MKRISHGQSKNPIYKIWSCMKQRCHNPKNPKFSYYGGRGITVCDRWMNNFPAFAHDMGERPDKFTVERKDVNGNYEPSNCYWASRRDQSLNTSKTRYIEIEGVTYKARILADICGLTPSTLIERSKTCNTLSELLSKDRRITPRGHGKKDSCKQGHPFTEENTKYLPKTGTRVCRTCSKIWNAKPYRRMKKALKG